MPAVNRSVNYFSDILYRLYQKQLNGSESNTTLHLYSSYPLYDILSNEEISTVDKFNAVLNFCFTKFQTETEQQSNEFWFMFEDKCGDFDKVIKEKNGRVIFQSLCQALLFTNKVPSEAKLLFNIMFKRISQKRECIENNCESDEMKIQRDAWFNNGMSLWQSIKMTLPERPTYWTFNNYGELITTRSRQPWVVLEYAVKPNYDKWLEQDVGQIKYGCELELDFRTNDKFQEFMEHALSQGWLYDSGLIPKKDSSLDCRLGVELVSAPMTYHKAFSFWKSICDFLKTMDVQTGYDKICAGLHIHVSREGWQGWQQRLFLDKINELENKTEFFGRKENRYCNYDFLRGANMKIKSLIDYNGSLNGDPVATVEIQAFGTGRFYLINASSKTTLEVRGYDSALNVDEKLEALNSIVSDCVSSEISLEQKFVWLKQIENGEW